MLVPYWRAAFGLYVTSNTLTPGQRLAFQGFQEGAAGGRNVGQAVSHAGDVQRRHRIAAAGKADKPAGLREFRNRLGHFDGAVVEGLVFEGAERAVPDQRP